MRIFQMTLYYSQVEAWESRRHTVCVCLGMLLVYTRNTNKKISARCLYVYVCVCVLVFARDTVCVRESDTTLCTCACNKEHVCGCVCVYVRVCVYLHMYVCVWFDARQPRDTPTMQHHRTIPSIYPIVGGRLLYKLLSKIVVKVSLSI